MELTKDKESGHEVGSDRAAAMIAEESPFPEDAYVWNGEIPALEDLEVKVQSSESQS